VGEILTEQQCKEIRQWLGCKTESREKLLRKASCQMDAMLDTIDALRAENNVLRRKVEAVEQMRLGAVLQHVTVNEWILQRYDFDQRRWPLGYEPHTTPWDALEVKEAE
jgi:hypothetical protein